MNDYVIYDHREITKRLFYPRPEWNMSMAETLALPLMIPVSPHVEVGAYFHRSGADEPTVLFFHGNGEIAADYHDFAPFFTQRGLNFLVVDYRGYGRSGGTPTVSAMMADCHAILEYGKTWLLQEGYRGGLIVMGRSLGSASALELAHKHPEVLDGLIVESGFAYITPLLRLLGIEPRLLDLPEEDLFQHTWKIRTFKKPTLIIHAQYDHIIACAEGKALFEASGAQEKRFVEIKGANHNNLFFLGMTEYLAAVTELADKIRQKR
ncbi:MAG: lysophospholipase [Syntrophales bacterium]|nr:lysophospholipase [Syntrophales bacterium]